ncbi:cysteine-rich CWC family protein [Pseudomaricurvus sp.]|uniref:cysteine-rich CWC family protein n=1 Tax=Pseudomaricurvus sp. TaxID=2004510 RepID=UPI003F6C062B
MNSALCPLCRKNNNCGNLKQPASSSEKLDCWCLHESIPSAALEALPPEQRGKSCICQSCAKAFTLSNSTSTSNTPASDQLAFPVGQTSSS